MIATAKRFRADRSGSTAIEYALIGVLVSIVIIAGARAVGNGVSAKFGFVANSVNAVTLP